jgi:hypothetical protein
MTKLDPTEAARDELMKEVTGFLMNLNSVHVDLKALQAAIYNEKMGQKQISEALNNLDKLRNYHDKMTRIISNWWATHGKLFEDQPTP